MLGQGFFIYGEETFLVDEAVQKIYASHPNATLCHFQEDCSRSNIQQATQSTGLFATETIVSIKNPLFLSKSLSKEESRSWIDCLKEGLNDQTVLIVYVHGTVDLRKSCASYLKKHFKTQMYAPFKDWEEEKMMRWARQRLESKGKSISDEALTILCQMVGNNLRKCANEIETVSIYLDKKLEVDSDAIRACCSEDQACIYAFSEAVKKRDVQKCFSALQTLKRLGEEPIKLLALIVSNFRLYSQLLALGNQPDAMIAKTVGKHPFYIKQVLKDIRKVYTINDLKYLMSALATLDYEIKSGQVKPSYFFSYIPSLLS